MVCWNDRDKDFKDRTVFIQAEDVDQVPERSHVST